MIYAYPTFHRGIEDTLTDLARPGRGRGRAGSRTRTIRSVTP